MNSSIQADLEDLVSSDTECFVDTSLQNGEIPTKLICQKCHKEYKRKHYYDYHVEKCTGKRTKQPVPGTQGSEYLVFF